MELGKRCNAVYICPKDGSVRKGPLVVYAGKDKYGRNLVGDIYFNFRRIEHHPEAVTAFAEALLIKLSTEQLLDSFDTICGIPNGGRTLGYELARLCGKGFTYPEKKEVPTPAGRKQDYEWDLSQFDFEPGERVAVTEDVFNNFQNTDPTLAKIEASGAKVVLLAGALNRSPIHDTTYTPKSGPLSGHPIRLVASIREAYPEYEQDDPAVAADIAAGRLEIHVKKNWARLCAYMQD